MLARCLDNVNAELYEYQKRGVAFMLRRRWVLLGDEQGLGKTLQAIALIAGTRSRAIVICPAMLRQTWLNEIRKFTTLIAEPYSAASAARLGSGVDVLVASYALISKLSLNTEADAVVIDECQYIKDFDAKRTVRVHEYIFQTMPKYVVALSGTPIKNKMVEFYSILRLLSYCPDELNGKPIREQSSYAFGTKFSHPVDRLINIRRKNGAGATIRKTEFEGYRNLETLRTYLKGKYMRRLAKDQLDLPPVTDKWVEVDVDTSPELEEAWNDVAGGVVATKAHVTKAKVASAAAKADSTIAYVKDLIEADEQVVVFSDHREPVRQIALGLRRYVPVGVLRGGDAQGKRDQNIRDFQSGRIRVLCCTIGAASTGITLTAGRHMVFNDLCWVPADVDQARKRIHRIGQGRPCVIHHIVAAGIDNDITRALVRKAELLKAVL